MAGRRRTGPSGGRPLGLTETGPRLAHRTAASALACRGHAAGVRGGALAVRLCVCLVVSRGVMSHVVRKVGLEAWGFDRAAEVHWNLSVAALYEQAVRRSEG